MRSLLITGALLAAASGCGSDTDDRPQTLEFITQTILAPSCATANCHSSFTQAEGVILSNVDDARTTLRNYVSPGDVSTDDGGLLCYLLSPGGKDAPCKRMPYDAPLANADINLIYLWIQSGAEGLDK
ncbi:MAG TPA: hypothetical protein VGM90_12960 [Kofleriaceae bacterium]|jgi:hypothetical protein